MRATSAFTNTMAVIMEGTLASGPSGHGEVAALVERHQVEARLVDGVVEGEVAGRAADRAGPLAVDVDQAHARRLEPAQDLLGLLGGRGRRGTGTAVHRLAAGDQLDDVLVGVGSGWDHPGRREPAVAYDVHGPALPPGRRRGVLLAAGGDQVRDGGQRREPLGARDRADEGGQAVAMDPR